MNGKRLAHIMVCSFSVAIMVLSYCYVEQKTARIVLYAVAGTLFCLFFILAIVNRDRKGSPRGWGGTGIHRAASIR